MTIVNNLTFKEDLEKLKALGPELCIDVETNGLDSYNGNQICGVGVGQTDHTGLMQYYPFRHHQGQNLNPNCLRELIQYLNTGVDTFIGYNIKFDLHFLEQEGLRVADKKLIDVIVMVRLIEHSDTKELSLSATAKRHYGEEAIQYDIDTKKQLRSNKWHKDFSMAPADFLGEYCKEDVRLTSRIYQKALKQIESTQQQKVFDLECELTQVLFQMEKRGISVDNQYALKVRDLLLNRLEDVQEEIYSLAGSEFNISSPAQIGEIFKNLNIESPMQTEKGSPSWNEVALASINHRLAGLIRQYRALEKLKSTYIEPYLETDIMRTSFCNWGTSTGRLSSREPNLQNIPRNYFKLATEKLNAEDREGIKNKIVAMVSARGKSLPSDLSDDVLETWAFVGDESFNPDDAKQIAIRRLFIPRDNYSLVSFDYSQMEVRVFMSYFRNEVIDELLNKDDVDFHGEAAKIAFGITEEDSEFKFYRQLAKGITFATIYGSGNKALAQQLNTTPQEAGKYKERYFKGMVGSKNFFDRVVNKVEQTGNIHNKYGRKYKINSRFAYKGVNYLVQGTSADILSERMIEIAKFLEDKESNILLQVHDEIIVEIHDSELDSIPFKIKDLLEQNSLNIPLKVDMEICTPSWATKKDFKEPSLDDYIDWSVYDER